MSVQCRTTHVDSENLKRSNACGHCATCTPVTCKAEASLPMQPCTPAEERHVWIWQCKHCQQDCVPVRSSSMCICGHRQQYHSRGSRPCDFKCTKCACKQYSFLMTEGSWALRCRCKHKHTEHDPNSRACKKPQCACRRFDSPWVCNCDHAWADHEHLLVEKDVTLVRPKQSAGAGALAESTALQAANGGMLGLTTGVEGGIAPEVNNYSLLKRGLQ
jgi:Protein FAM221A/B